MHLFRFTNIISDNAFFFCFIYFALISKHHSNSGHLRLFLLWTGSLFLSTTLFYFTVCVTVLNLKGLYNSRYIKLIVYFLIIDTNGDISPVVHPSNDSRRYVYNLQLVVSSLYKTANKLEASKTYDCLIRPKGFHY